MPLSENARRVTRRPEALRHGHVTRVQKAAALDRVPNARGIVVPPGHKGRAARGARRAHMEVCDRTESACNASRFGVLITGLPRQARSPSRHRLLTGRRHSDVPARALARSAHVSSRVQPPGAPARATLGVVRCSGVPFPRWPSSTLFPNHCAGSSWISLNRRPSLGAPSIRTTLKVTCCSPG